MRSSMAAKLVISAGGIPLDAFCTGLVLVEAQQSHFRGGERSPGDHAVIDLEFLDATEQGVDRRGSVVPGGDV